MVINSPKAETVFERFEIEFDAGSDAVFHGGELITGSLKIQLKNEITINSIKVEFKGHASWQPDNKKKCNEKIYFDKCFTLLERPPGQPLPGHFPWRANFLYSLPFEFPLPKGCETSYESPYGFVRYSALAILETDEPYKAQYIVKKAFSIVQPPELHRLVPPASEPITEKKTIHFGTCCCRGKITAEIVLPKTAYAPGENIVGILSIDSRSAKSAAEHIEVRLVDCLQLISDPGVSVLDNPTEENGKQAAKPQKKKGTNAKEEQKLLNQRVVSGRKLGKEDLDAQQQNKGVLFIRVPACPPSTQLEPERQVLHQSIDANLELENADENGEFHRLMESPSTATLRQRKEPFLQISYALQVSIGTHVLLQIPIQVHPIPMYAKGIQFRPFPIKAQPISEQNQNEQQAIPFGGPFTFTPLYPMYLVSPLAVDEPQIQPITTNIQNEQQKMPNGEKKTSSDAKVDAIPSTDNFQKGKTNQISTADVLVEHELCRTRNELGVGKPFEIENNVPHDVDTRELIGNSAENQIDENSRDEHLENEHNSRQENGKTVQRVVEVKEEQYEDGSKMVIQTTTTTEMTNNSVESHGNHEEGTTEEINNEQLQMDVSMSG